jgi:DNA primase
VSGPNLSAPMRDALVRIRDTNDEGHTWRGLGSIISANTAAALAQRGFIELLMPGRYFARITDAGRAALASEAGK